MKITITTRNESIEKVSLELKKEFEIEWIGKPLKKAEEWIKLYAQGVQPTFLPPLDSPHPIHQALCEIPFGQTLSYKEFARRVGYEGAHRFIGTMIGKNRYPLFLPCHRVIRSDGTIGGFAFGSDVKAEILKHEKLTVN